MNYKEMLSIISKPWVNVEDIMKLCNVGRNNATKIRQSIEKSIKESGKLVPASMTKYVPTKLLLEYVNLDEDYIIKMANKCSLGGNYGG